MRVATERGNWNERRTISRGKPGLGASIATFPRRSDQGRDAGEIDALSQCPS